MVVVVVDVLVVVVDVVVKHVLRANCANFGAGANFSKFCNNMRHFYAFFVLMFLRQKLLWC